MLLGCCKSTLPGSIRITEVQLLREPHFKNNDANLDYYKNDVTWCFIELVADQLVCEYENTTCEQLSELDEDVYPALTELAKSDFWKEGHGYNDLRDSLGDIVHSKWGQDHLEIINA